MSGLGSLPKREDSLSQKSNKRPLYLRVIDELALIIDSLEPGDYLPSEPKLAKQLGVSRATLREAMRAFEMQGVIVRRQGVGTYVTQTAQVIEAGLEILESLDTMAERIGLEIQMEDLQVRDRLPTDEEARLFDIRPHAPVLEIARTLCAENRPMTYLIDVLPKGVLSHAIDESTFNGSILDLLLRQGEPELSHSRTEITAVAASPVIARGMQIQRGNVLLMLEAWLCGVEGRAIDHSLSYFLPGTFRFHVVRRVGSR